MARLVETSQIKASDATRKTVEISYVDGTKGDFVLKSESDATQFNNLTNEAIIKYPRLET